MVAAMKFEVVPLVEVPRHDLMHSEGRGRGMILVVHDERVVADCMATLLRRAGFEARTAYDGWSGLEMALAVSPDLLISDVGIRGIDGVHLAMLVVQAIPGCKVLLFSSCVTTDGVLNARAEGYDFSSLAKPVHPAAAMEQVLASFGFRPDTRLQSRSASS